MAPLISFSRVCKGFPDGGEHTLVLDEVSFEIEGGVSVGVYGGRRSGKSTLLRVAAGIESVDSGVVRFGGRDIAEMASSERARLLGGAIAFMAANDWRPNPSETVLDYVALALGSHGLTVREAKRRALRTLDEVGVRSGCAEDNAGSLSLAERTRVMLARALVRRPRLLIVDEPALMPGLGDRDRFYALLRSTARDRNMTLLMASEEMAALQGVQVLMSIADGELCSTEERATVVQLPTRRRPGARRQER